MSSTKNLVKNAIDKIEITDYIMLIRDECMTVILVEDFIKDIVLGGDAVCDTLLSCWKTMGQFDGGTNPDNGDDDPCNCNDDFVKLHFPKGEGVKIITEESQANIPDSVYILKVEDGSFELIVVDEEGNKRNLTQSSQIDLISSDDSVKIEVTEDGKTDLTVDFPVVDYPVIDAKSSSDYGVPIYDGLDSDKKIKILPVSSGEINITKKTTPEGHVYLDFKIPESIDDTIKSYYVNEKYSNENGNGSPLRPYKRYTKALEAVIGTGSIINPENKNAKIFLQSDVTVRPIDLANSLILENRITVNTTIVQSDSGYKITYQGTQEEPISTSFLKNKALSTGYKGEVGVSYDNVNIYSETVKNIVNFETFQNSDFNTYHNLNNFSVEGLYTPNVYTDFIPPVTILDAPVKGQSSIVNNSPTVYLHGFNNSMVGSFNITGNFTVKSASQTALRVENTAITMDNLTLEANPFFVSVDTMTNKNPKTGVNRLDVINSYLVIDNLIIPDITSGAGGNDSLISFTSTSYTGSDLIINNGILKRTRYNKILSVNDTLDKTVKLNKCDFRDAIIEDKAFVNALGTTPTKVVDVEGSFINDVTDVTDSGIQITALLAYINRSQFTTMPEFPTNALALEAGLIKGNFFVDASRTPRVVE